MAIRSTGIRPIERNGLRGFGLTLTIDNTNSPDTLPVEANSAGEAPSSPASPARHSDDIDLTIPAFLRRDEGRGYPKRESVGA